MNLKVQGTEEGSFLATKKEVQLALNALKFEYGKQNSDHHAVADNSHITKQICFVFMNSF